MPEEKQGPETVDLMWSKRPNRFVTIQKGRRKFREFRSMIPEILSRLGPEDPVDFQEKWEDEKVVDAKNDGKDDKKGNGREPNKRDAIRMKNTADQDEKGFGFENERITNMAKDGLNALIGTRKQVKTSRGTLKLLLEILRLAVNDKDYTSVYDILWVIETNSSFQEYEKEKTSSRGGGGVVNGTSSTPAAADSGGSAERYLALKNEAKKMKQAQLQKECAKRGLETKGSKEDLLKRLLVAFKEESEAPVIPSASDGKEKKSKDEKKSKKKEKEAATSNDSNTKSTPDPIKIMLDEVYDVIQRARQWRLEEPDMIKKQLTDMSHLLPPLSPFTCSFKLDDWQKNVLKMIRNEKSVLICAPTSSGKTVLSTHVASMGRKIGNSKATTRGPLQNGEEEVIIVEEEGDEEDILDEDDEDERLRAMMTRESVLFIVPSDPLVWQVAAHFAKWQGLDSDVALITERLTYAPRVASSGRAAASVVIGTPLAVENALTRIRGRVERRLVEHLSIEQQKKLTHNIGEFVGGFDHFKWVVYDEVHSLGNNTPDGMALQRLIKALKCKFLALSATVGNAGELKDWMQQVKGEQVNAELVNAPVVEAETHEGRFINLQRHAWISLKKGAKKSDGTLANADGVMDLVTLHPLSAVSFEFLCEDGFSKSSLPMTPQDSYTLWKRMEELFDTDIVKEFNPHEFFKPEDGRITLLKTRDYELKLKDGLVKLAKNYPDQTKQLLSTFSMNDMAPEFSLYNLINGLRVKDTVGNDKLPAIVFHLDFAHIVGRFKELLYGLEKAQRDMYPDYYTALEKRRQMNDLEKLRALDACSTEEEKEEILRDSETAGTVDLFQPHPDFVLYAKSPISRPEYDEILEDVAKTDFQGDQAKAKSHPIMRALRRGIGLFVDEVTLQAYKRNITRLATKGKLGVVFSDESLAFGVNMPFRTCVFCGDMGGKLNTTLVQQMSGRAGRRGLDTQGHLVYAGAPATFVKSMLIAEIPAVKGKDPRYFTMFLQSMLSENTDRGDFKNQVSTIGSTPLYEFHNDKAIQCNMTDLSREFLMEMKFIEKCDLLNLSAMDEEQKKVWKGRFSYEQLDDSATRSGYRAYRPFNAAILSMMWILRTRCAESIILGKLVPLLYKDFAENRTKSDAETEEVQFEFVASLLHIIDRRPALPDGYIMSENSFITNTSVLKRQELRDRILKINKSVKSYNDKIMSLHQSGKYPYIDQLKIAVDDEQPVLDGTLLHCFIEGHTNDIAPWRKHEVKEQLWSLGNVLKVLHDFLWPDKNRYGKLETVARKCFMRTQYILSDHIKDAIDFQNISAHWLEEREDVSGISDDIENSINELLQLKVVGESGVTL